MSLIELAERVEKASGPDRLLDALICREIGPCKEQPDGTWITYFEGGYSHDIFPAPVTASLDAAMSLVPEGVGWSIGFGMVPGLGDAPQLFVALQDGPDMRAYAGYATPALALVAAALRARATQENG